MARPSPLTFKDHFRETHLFQQRVLVAVVLLALVLCLIIARLVYLQVINHEHYTTLSEDNRLNILPITLLLIGRANPADPRADL